MTHGRHVLLALVLVLAEVLLVWVLARYEFQMGLHKCSAPVSTCMVGPLDRELPADEPTCILGYVIYERWTQPQHDHFLGWVIMFGCRAYRLSWDVLQGIEGKMPQARIDDFISKKLEQVKDKSAAEVPIQERCARSVMEGFEHHFFSIGNGISQDLEAKQDRPRLVSGWTKRGSYSKFGSRLRSVDAGCSMDECQTFHKGTLEERRAREIPTVVWIAPNNDSVPGSSKLILVYCVLRGTTRALVASLDLGAAHGAPALVWCLWSLQPDRW